MQLSLRKLLLGHLAGSNRLGSSKGWLLSRLLLESWLWSRGKLLLRLLLESRLLGSKLLLWLESKLLLRLLLKSRLLRLLR